MGDSDIVDMTAEERDEFLGTGGTGVISFTREIEDPPHSVPVSYGYDQAESAFYFRLSTGPDSEKGDLVDRQVSFVTYDQSGSDWQSVVAQGQLVRTTDESIATQALEGLQRVSIPYVDIFPDEMRDISFEFFRLDPAELTGRTER